jgi:DNA polymerase-3 subunit beta
LVSRLVDGNYPDYRQIIPADSTTQVIVLRQDFIHALQTVTLFSDKFTQMDMTIDNEAKTCTCFSEQADVGRAQAVIKVQTTGESITLRYNARYLLDCLQVISSDSITLECTTPQRPMIVRPAGDQDFMYLIMPLHRSS